VTVINNTYGFIFIHVPKNAGTTMTHYLSQFTHWNDLEIGGTPFGEQLVRLYGPRFKIAKHTRAERLREIIGPAAWQGMFTFGLVRHPLPRSYSTYRFLQRWRDWRGSEIMDGFPTFESFVTSRFFLQQHGPDDMFRGQCHWLCDADGALLVDHVGRVEALGETIDRLHTHVGAAAAEMTLPRRNASAPADEFLNMATPLARRLITLKYQRDFATFGYEPGDLG
jgi:hypothetical protein